MIEAVKRVQQKVIQQGDEQMLFPVNHMVSGSDINLNVCSFVNQRFFYCDKSILLKILSLRIKYRGFTKYYKPKKFDKTKFDFVVELLKRKHFWGQNDIMSARKVIEKLINNREEMLKLADDFGLDNKQRKLLGVDSIKFDKTLVKKVKTKSLMDW